MTTAAQEAPPSGTSLNLYADEVNLVMDKRKLAAEESYTTALANSEGEDFDDLDQLEVSFRHIPASFDAIKLAIKLAKDMFWQEHGRDNSGAQIIRVVGKYLPVKVIQRERLRRYVYHKMHERVAADVDFSVAYIHTGVVGGENHPGMLWLKEVYDSLPWVCKQRVKAVYVLHPALWMRLALWAFGGWLTDNLYEKMTFVSRVEFMWDYMKRGQLDIPEFVAEHDTELESRPLMDYGIEVDPHTAAQHLPHGGLGPRVF